MKILMVFGTRPEAIKMAPVVYALRSIAGCDTEICVTAQHREMLDQVLKIFQLKPRYDLDLMSKSQSLSKITSSILQAMDRVIADFEPDWIFVQGDTSTSMAASLSAYYRKIRIAHIEAGLRTWDLYSPWPEEGNRQITSRLADLHFCPTSTSEENLIKEGISRKKIHVTGNTVIDALLQVSGQIDGDDKLKASLEARFSFLNSEKRLILITAHRRENFGESLELICGSLRAIARDKSVEIIFPVHLNPLVKEPVHRILSGFDNIHLIEPQDYLPFVYLMKRSYFILTDSGGVQEEAPSLGKPVLVMRNTTERPEAVAAGSVKLVGADKSKITNETFSLLNDLAAYQNMSRSHNPYGDGKAAARIASILMAQDRCQSG